MAPWNGPSHEILVANKLQWVESHQHVKYRQILSIADKDIKIFLFKMAAAAILEFQICEILLADGVWGAQTHHCAKCHQNRSFHCGDIAIF